MILHNWGKYSSALSWWWNQSERKNQESKREQGTVQRAQHYVSSSGEEQLAVLCPPFRSAFYRPLLHHAFPLPPRTRVLCLCCHFAEFKPVFFEFQSLKIPSRPVATRREEVRIEPMLAFTMVNILSSTRFSTLPGTLQRDRIAPMFRYQVVIFCVGR